MALVETSAQRGVRVRQENVVNGMATVVVPGIAGIIGGAVATVPSHELGHAVVSTGYSLAVGGGLAENRQVYEGAVVDFIVGGGKGLNVWVNATAEQIQGLTSRDHFWTALWDLGGFIETSLIGTLAIAAALPLLVDGVKNKNTIKVAMGAFIGGFGVAMEVMTNAMLLANTSEGHDLFLAAQALRQMNFSITPEELAYQITTLMMLGIFALPIINLLLSSRQRS
jgi:hypothetical protein